jgi:hypothetical protein
VGRNASKIIELEEDIFSRDSCFGISFDIPNLPSELSVVYDIEEGVLNVRGTVIGVYELVMVAWVDGFQDIEIAQV